MIKRPPQDPTAPDLTARERILLFCVASGTDWQQAVARGESSPAASSYAPICRRIYRAFALTLLRDSGERVALPPVVQCARSIWTTRGPRPPMRRIHGGGRGAYSHSHTQGRHPLRFDAGF
jgi:hypothetical protein